MTMAITVFMLEKMIKIDITLKEHLTDKHTVFFFLKSVLSATVGYIDSVYKQIVR